VFSADDTYIRIQAFGAGNVLQHLGI